MAKTKEPFKKDGMDNKFGKTPRTDEDEARAEEAEAQESSVGVLTCRTSPLFSRSRR